jgi:hypothetical protein
MQLRIGRRDFKPPVAGVVGTWDEHSHGQPSSLHRSDPNQPAAILRMLDPTK